MKATATAPTFDVIPTSDYILQAVNHEDVENTMYPESGRQFRWTFEVIARVTGTGATLKADTSDESVGKQIKAWTSQSSSLKGYAMAYAGALLGHTIEEGEEVDYDALMGRQALGSVVVTTNKKGTEFSKLDSLRPIPKRTKPTAQAAAKPVAGVTGSTGRAAQPEDDYDPFEAE